MNEEKEYITKKHDDDVIFSRESLKEFMRIVQDYIDQKIDAHERTYHNINQD